MKFRKLIHKHQLSILTGMTIAGVAATSLAASKAAVKAMRHIDALDPLQTKRETQIRNVKETWQFFVPSALLGTATVSAVLTTSKVHAKRTQAASVAVAVATSALEEYREEVAKVVGVKKAREIAENHVLVQAQEPPSDLTQEPSSVLCCDVHTGRYFNTTVESIQRAVNVVNRTAIYELHATLNEFYEEVGLDSVPSGDKLGWFADRPLEVTTAAAKSTDDRPYLAFRFSHMVPV
jgi:hypothetical protein